MRAAYDPRHPLRLTGNTSMRNTPILAMSAAVLLLAGCGSLNTPTVNTQPVTQAAVQAPSFSTPDTPDTPTPTPTQEPAHVGDPIVLKGAQDGDEMTVTLVRVAPTVTGGDIDNPDAGDRYFAAQFKLVNTGTGTYDDAPDNGAKALDSMGQQFGSTIVSQNSAGPMFPVDVRLAPGGVALGWVVFQVPAASKITAVQFGLESGMGNAGQWQVP